MALSALYIHVHVYHILSYVFIGLRRSSPTMFHTLFVIHDSTVRTSIHNFSFLNGNIHASHFLSLPCIIVSVAFIHVLSPLSIHFFRSCCHFLSHGRVHIKQIDNGYIICNHNKNTSSSAVHRLRRCWKMDNNYRPEIACSDKNSASKKPRSQVQERVKPSVR